MNSCTENRNNTGTSTSTMNCEKYLLTQCSNGTTSPSLKSPNRWFAPIPSDRIESPIHRSTTKVSSTTDGTIKALDTEQKENICARNKSCPATSHHLPYFPSSDALDEDDSMTMNQKKFILPFRRQRPCTAIPNYMESNLSWLYNQDIHHEQQYNVENEIIEQTKRWNLNESFSFPSFEGDDDDQEEDDAEIAFYWTSTEKLVCP